MSEPDFADINREVAIAAPRSHQNHDVHRLLPQSSEAEQGLIACLLLSPVEVAMLLASAGCNPKWFHIPAHEEVYRATMALLDAAQPVDFIKVATYLKDREKLAGIGGASFLSSLYTFVPTAANARYYLEIVSEKYTLREMINVATSYAGRAYDEQDQVAQLLDGMEADVMRIRPKDNRTKSSNKEIVMQCIGDIQSMFENRGKVSGLTTGFPVLDRMTDGLQPAEMIVIAARPSYGKTAFAMRIAEHVSMDLRKPIGVFSLEMSTKQLVKRMLGSMARVDYAKVRDGFLEDRDFPAITAASARIAGAPIHFDDTESLTIQDFRSKLRQMVKVNRIECAFVDYLQLMRSTSKRAQENRNLEVAEISSGLKAAAKELNIPIVALAQINRGLDMRGIHARPKLADLRESGSIEQDADVVAFIDRPEKRAETDDEKEFWRGKAELVIAKQRNGPCGEVPLTFLEQYTRFETRAPMYEEPEQQANMDY